MKYKISNSKKRHLGNRYLLLFLFIMLFFNGWAQPDEFKSRVVAEQLHSLANDSPPELAYIQTNKGIYETGEDLWFKVYLLNSQYFIPSNLSETLYLQLLKEGSKQVIWQEKYKIQNGFASGHVYIQDTLTEGDYLLAAITSNSFFNDTSEFNAIRKITVKKEISPQASVTAKYDQPYYIVAPQSLVTAKLDHTFYTENDTIRIFLTALSKQMEPLYAEIVAVLWQRDKELVEVQAKTNESGEAVIAFQPKYTTSGLKVIIKVAYTNREETLTLPIPYIKGNQIQFTTFPEGGHLVSGIKSKLAFKAVNSNGEPVDILGTLFEDNYPVLEFKSTHAGMGSLDFTPSAGKKYHIQLSEPSVDSAYLLPEILNTGLAMRMDRRDKEFLTLKISQSPRHSDEAICLRAQVRGIVYWMAIGQLEKEVIVKIPLNKFPQGIAEITLFNNDLVPVAERLVYVNQDKVLYIETELSEEKYATRDKAILKVAVKDENGQPIVAHLGVSVYDKIYQNTQDPKNILSHYYLSSQLKGTVYNPGYYFNNDNEDREETLDLLLQTQGWRKYVWGSEVLKGQEAKRQVIFDGIIGEVFATKKRKTTSAEQQFVLAYNPGENEDADFILADPSGKFTVTPRHLKLWQGGYVYLKPMIPPDSKPRINIAEPFEKISIVLAFKKMVYPIPGLINAKEDTPRPFIVGPNVIELGEVIVMGERKSPVRDKYMGHLDSLAKLDLNTDYVCVSNVLNCPIHEHDDRNRNPVEGDFYDQYVGFKWIGEREAYTYSSFIKKEYKYPKFTEEWLLKMYNLSRIKGYYGHREFYQPDYDKEPNADFIPDFRNTLVWEPSLITNEKGEATLNFFCSDINTTFLGKIEGVSSDGLLGSQDFKVIVLKLKPFKWEK